MFFFAETANRYVLILIDYIYFRPMFLFRIYLQVFIVLFLKSQHR